MQYIINFLRTPSHNGATYGEVLAWCILFMTVIMAIAWQLEQIGKEAKQKPPTSQ